MEYSIKVGIIGGSGLDDPDILSDRVEITVNTDFGMPSDVLIQGNIMETPCVLLARHGRNHTIMPGNVNYRANISALKQLGCTHVLVSTACGSLREELCPGDIVILDSFIDRTQKRALTLYDGSSALYPGICHIPMEPAFCTETRRVLAACAETLKLKYHDVGTCVTVEGPRFSSKAESRLFKSWGCDVINMTTVPEVILAKEAGLCYAAVALITDYDCWREEGSYVNVGDVMETFQENIKNVTDLLTLAVVEIKNINWDECIDSLRDLVKSNTIY